MMTTWILLLCLGYVSAENYRLQPQFKPAVTQGGLDTGRRKVYYNNYNMNSMSSLGPSVAAMDTNRLNRIAEMMPDKFKDAILSGNTSAISVRDIKTLDTGLLEILPPRFTNVLNFTQLNAIIDGLMQGEKLTALFRLLDLTGMKFGTSHLLEKIHRSDGKGGLAKGLLQVLLKKVIPEKWTKDFPRKLGEKLGLIPPSQLVRVNDREAARELLHLLESGDVELNFRNNTIDKKSLSYKLVDAVYGDPKNWSSEDIQSVSKHLPDFPPSYLDELESQIIVDDITVIREVKFDDPKQARVIVNKYLTKKNVTQRPHFQVVEALGMLGPLAAYIAPQLLTDATPDVQETFLERMTSALSEMGRKIPVRAAQELISLKLDGANPHSADWNSLGISLLQTLPLNLLQQAGRNRLVELADAPNVRSNRELNFVLGNKLKAQEEQGENIVDVSSFPKAFFRSLGLDFLVTSPPSYVNNILRKVEESAQVMDPDQKLVLFNRVKRDMDLEDLPADIRAIVPPNDLKNLSVEKLKKLSNDLPAHTAPRRVYARKKLKNDTVTVYQLESDLHLTSSLTSENVKDLEMDQIFPLLSTVQKAPDPPVPSVMRLLKKKFQEYLYNITGDKNDKQILEHMSPAEAVNLPGSLFGEFSLNALKSPKIASELKIQLMNKIGGLPEVIYRRFSKSKREAAIEEGLKALDEYIDNESKMHENELSTVHVAGLGAGIQDLSPSSIERLTPDAFEQALLMLQGTKINGVMVTRACLNEKQRTAMRNQLVKIYGSTDQWDSVLILSLCCLLHVLEPDDLETLPPDVIVDCDCEAEKPAPAELEDLKTDLEASCRYELDDEFDSVQDSLDFVKRRKVEAAIYVSVERARKQMERQKREEPMPLTCEAIQLAGSGAKFKIEELQTLPTDHLQDCLVFLGKDELEQEQAEFLWDSLVEVYEGVPNIPEDSLKLLGWIIAAISPDDLRNISFTEIDIVKVFGEYRNQNLSQLQVLAEQVKVDLSASPEEYTYFHLIALKQILCGFNRSEIELIKPEAYAEAAPILKTLKNCPHDALQGLATLAMDSSAFGDPSSWTTADVHAVGCILGGLPQDALVRIPPAAMSGLTAETIKCLPSLTVKAMTTDQLGRLSVPAAQALTSEQKSALSEGQQQVVEEAIEGERMPEDSGSSVTLSLGLLLSTILLHCPIQLV